jgi:hypothetical protein
MTCAFEFIAHPMPPTGVRVTVSNDRGYRRCQWHIRGKQYRLQQHLYIWQSHFGPLPSGYVVHHIDGNRANNSLGNLQAMSNSAHSGLHRTKHGIYAGSRSHGDWSYQRTKHLSVRLILERQYRENHRPQIRKNNQLYRERHNQLA